MKRTNVSALIVGIFVFIQDCKTVRILETVDGLTNIEPSGNGSKRMVREINEEPIKDLTIKLCALEIRVANFQIASKMITDINDNSAIEKVISEAYNHKDIDRVLQFVNSLDTHERITLAAEAVYEKFKADDILTTSPFVLYLHEEIIKRTLSKSSGNVHTKLKTLDTKLDTTKPSLLRFLGERVRERGCDEKIIANYLISHGTIHNVFNDIIESAYECSKKVIKNILKCIEMLPPRSKIELAYKKLFDVVKRNQHLNRAETLLLAYKIKEKKHFNPNAFLAIERELSSAIHKVIWREQVYLWNNDKNRYFYAATDGYVWNTAYRRVFTWIPKEGSFGDAIWIFETSDEGETFKIKNVMYNEYLQAASPDDDDDRYDDDRRFVYTITDKSSHNPRQKWLIELAGVSTVRIKNHYYNEYLFASKYEYNDKRGRVFTWRIDEYTPEDLWILKPT